ncbi:MAG: hypothetical protein CBC42_01270 [Betaproteobacteria bacterium TMED82]|nr:MAG: hypothetical protein CBC42_01270 [Betaproteobacteria bacterium TMED82]
MSKIFGSSRDGKRKLLFLLFLAAAVFVYFYFNYLKILGALLFVMPLHYFDDKRIPDPYHYVSLTSWAAHPKNLDLITFLPKSIPKSANRDSVVVFFVHPTTFIDRSAWNQPKNDERANNILKRRGLINQASIFSACCEVYVPKYRQATLYSFIDLSDNGSKAFDVAYEDIKRSFLYFDKHIRKGRPYFIASHSQGTMHSVRLLQELQQENTTFNEMIAAFLVGYRLTESDIGSFEVCDGPKSINCILAWNSVEKDGFVTFKSKENLICVNPLSWQKDGTFMGKSSYMGGVGFEIWNYKDSQKITKSELEFDKSIEGVRCKNGNLEIIGLASDNYPVRLFSLHAYDYGLFFLNILHNLAIRVEAYHQVNDKGNL